MGREIPIIDVSPLVNGTGIGPEIAKQIHEACLEYGFFQAVNSGISATFQSDVLEVTTRFFDLPVEIKRKIEKPREGFRGYVKFSGEMTNGKADWREGIYHFPDFPGSGPAGRAEAEFSGRNPWPDEDLPEFRIKVTEFFEKATNLGYKMMEAIAIGLGECFNTSARFTRARQAQASARNGKVSIVLRLRWLHKFHRVVRTAGCLRKEWKSSHCLALASQISPCGANGRLLAQGMEKFPLSCACFTNFTVWCERPVACARNGKVPIVLRLLHKFHHGTAGCLRLRLRMRLLYTVWTGL